MNATFYHTGPAHELVMAIIKGAPYNLVNVKNETLMVTPRVEDKDFSVVIAKEGSTKKVTVPVRFSGPFTGDAIMTLCVFVCDEGFEASEISDEPNGLTQFWSSNGRAGPCVVNFQ